MPDSTLTVCLERLINEGTLDLKLASNVVEPGADLWEFHAMATTNGGKDMRFHKIDKGQILSLPII